MVRGRRVVMVVTPVIWVGRGLGGVVWGPGCLAVKCRYLYGPIEGGKPCHVGQKMANWGVGGQDRAGLGVFCELYAVATRTGR